jgi:hypothetical protein
MATDGSRPRVPNGSAHDEAAETEGPDLQAFLEAAVDPAITRYPGRLAIKKRDGLSAAEREVEARFAARLESDLNGAVAEYRARFGSILNTDSARELCAAYAASWRSRAEFSTAVHEPASALVRELWGRAVALPDPDGPNAVIVLAGGGGSGKTSIFEDAGEGGELGLGSLRAEATAVYDTTLAWLPFAKEIVETALTAGKNVLVVYVHRPVRLAVLGVIERALREGRAVPARVLAADHFNAQNTLIELFGAYHDDGRVRIVVVDNSGAPSDRRRMEVAELRRQRYESLEQVAAQVQQVIDDEHAQRSGADRIPEPIYQALNREDIR